MKAIVSCQIPFSAYGFSIVQKAKVEALKEKHEVTVLTPEATSPHPDIVLRDALFKDNYFDALYSILLDHSASVLDCCAHAALFQFSVFDGVKLLERGSVHIAEQNNLLAKEGSPIPKIIIKKQLKEYKLADHILVPSQYVANSFRKWNKDLEHKLFINPLGVDTEMFKPQEKRDDIFRVLFAGTLSKQKGTHYLLEAYEKFFEQSGATTNNTELLLVGGIKEDISPSLKQHILFRHAAVNYERMPEVYRDASVVVLPSVQDGFGFTVLEALACGKPVIVSENVGAKDCVGKNGFIVPFSDKFSDAIADCLHWCYDNQNSLRLWSEAARKQAEKYTWEAYKQRYVKFVEGLA